MDKTHMRAPALIAGDLPRLLPAHGRFPKRLEIHAVIAQVRQRLAEFAGADAAIEVDDGGCLPGGAWHGPFLWPVHVIELGAVVKRQRGDIRHPFQRTNH